MSYSTAQAGWKNWNGSEVIDKFRATCSGAMLDAGGEMKTEVLQQIPHDEGQLQDTVIHMLDPADNLTVIVAAGGGGASGMPEVPYAVKWHETVANFQKGRKSQYVRDPLKQTMPKAIKRQLKKRGLR